MPALWLLFNQRAALSYLKSAETLRILRSVRGIVVHQSGTLTEGQRGQGQFDCSNFQRCPYGSLNMHGVIAVAGIAPSQKHRFPIVCRARPTSETGRPPKDDQWPGL